MYRFATALFLAPAGLAFGVYRVWRLALAIFAYIPLTIAIMSPGLTMMREAAKILSPLTAKAGGVAETTLTAVQTVAAFDGLEHEVQSYDQTLIEVEAGGNSIGKAMAFLEFFIEPLLEATRVTAFVIGTYFVMQSYDQRCWDEVTGDTASCYTGATVMAVMTAIMMGGGSLMACVQMTGALMQARVAAARFYTIIDEPAAFELDSGEPIALEDTRGRVIFQDVSFSYPTRPEIKALDTVSYTIEADQSVAFVGPSGSGKSTSIGLLMRYYDPHGGNIYLDGRDITKLNLKQMRLTFGLVQQEPLFVPWQHPDQHHVRQGGIDERGCD